jgi:hypothetical protein
MQSKTVRDLIVDMLLVNVMAILDYRAMLWMRRHSGFDAGGGGLTGCPFCMWPVIKQWGSLTLITAIDAINNGDTFVVFDRHRVLASLCSILVVQAIQYPILEELLARYVIPRMKVLHDIGGVKDFTVDDWVNFEDATSTRKGIIWCGICQGRADGPVCWALNGEFPAQMRLAIRDDSLDSGIEAQLWERSK